MISNKQTFSKRTMKKITTPSFSILVIVAMFLFVDASLILAQPGPGADNPQRRERIETVIIGKFSSELDLTPDQAEKFFPRLKQHHNQIEQLQKEQMESRDKLDQLSQDPKADKAEVAKLLDQSNEKQRQMADLKRALLSDVSGYLTPQQVSKCSLLLDDLPRQVREFIQQRRMHRGMGDEGPGMGQKRRHGN
jgi:septal ring factor EnvC (AmiA/AmiB activator)